MKTNKSIWFKIAIFASIIILVIFLHYVKILRPLEGLITNIFKPVQASLYKLSLTLSDPKILKEKEQLISENNDLSSQINALLAENTTLKNQQADEQNLQIEYNFLKTEPYQYQFAKIINKTTTDNAQIVTINQGKNKDLQIGMPIIFGEGYVIGKIISVEPNTADVLLLTSNSSNISAQVQSNDNAQGLIVGKHGLSLEMQLIPKGNQIVKDNLVITSGTENKVPKGLIIGKIDTIENKANDLFDSAQIIPIMDYTQISVVSVIKI